MELPEPKQFIVLDEIDVLRARKAAREMALEVGFEATRAAEIEIAVSELGGNFVKHLAVRGEIILTIVIEEDEIGLEIVASDRGPGISDLAWAMVDGHTTTNSLGIGLSGVKRLMDEFIIESNGYRGTTVAVKRWLGKGRSVRLI